MLTQRDSQNRDEPGYRLIPVWTGEQIRAAEQPLLNVGEGEALMRRASWGLAAHILQILQAQRGSVYGATVVGLIGSGNNGGDGLYALAFLRRRGVDARAVLLRPTCHTQALAAFRQAGGKLQTTIDDGADLILDAVVGTGFSGSFDAPSLPQDSVVVACDLPSGVDAETGAVRGTAIRADHTVTFGGLKTGLLLGQGRAFSGVLHTVDIGLGAHLPEPTGYVMSELVDTLGTIGGAGMTTQAGVDNLLRFRPGDTQRIDHSSGSGGAARNLAGEAVPVLRRRGPDADAHKYSRGVLHLLVGSARYPGAAQLSVGAALATGVGMAQVQAPDAVAQAVVNHWPETVASNQAERAAAMVIGPGLGDDSQRLAQAEALLQQSRRNAVPCVLDASALALITPKLLADPGYAGSLGKHTVLTPHTGEAQKLAERLGDLQLQDALAEQKVLAAAPRLAQLTGAVVVLKGPVTVIATPGDEPPLLHTEPAPGLATAGTGDVLAGIIGALLATQEESARYCAALGVALHAAAARRLDPRGHGRYGASALLRVLAD
ncbi:NAD(P)H-hydrate dehydratase [Nesterenkonia massiliensis]|uniref:NAD(P)H-hydrate dehydratase n=1 Tax=Nesterenkonia massiliensis TaxID=1232429 RepID=UPI0003F88C07|nr:NAD(P)H-hydrate dehydratase [Nesterenkonia massiliensis]